MALVRWEPVRELSSLQNEMNRLFNTFFDTPTAGNGDAPARRWIPAMDLVETDDHFVLKADLPGLAEDDVNIEVEDNVLTVSGERKAEHEDKREGYVRVERSYGAFRRSLTLPEGVDPEAVTASFDKRRARGPHPQARGAQAAPRRHPGRRPPGRRSRATRPRRRPSATAPSLRARARRGPAVVLARLGLAPRPRSGLDLGLDQRLGPAPAQAQHEPQHDAGEHDDARRPRARRGG